MRLPGSKGVVFATGTPVSEFNDRAFHDDALLAMGYIEAKHLNHFDSWASTFGETTTAIELAPEGTDTEREPGLQRFFNLPELMNIFREVADIKTSDQLHLPVPEAVYHNVVAKPRRFRSRWCRSFPSGHRRSMPGLSILRLTLCCA